MLHLLKWHTGQTWWLLCISVVMLLAQIVNVNSTVKIYSQVRLDFGTWTWCGSFLSRMSGTFFCSFVACNEHTNLVQGSVWLSRFITLSWGRTAIHENVWNYPFLVEKHNLGLAIQCDTRWKRLWQWHTGCTCGIAVWRRSLLEQ